MNHEMQASEYETAAVVTSAPMLRPGKLVAVAVISIVLASLGLLSSVSQTVSLVGAKKLQQFQLKSASVQPKMKQAMETLFDGTNRVTQRYFRVNMLMAIAGLTISGVLLIAAIQSLRARDSGRRLLRAMLLCAAVFVCVRLIPVTLSQREMIPVMEAYTSAIFEQAASSSNQAPGKAVGAQFAAGMARMQIVAQIVFAGLWALGVVVFAIVGYIYLGRAHTIAFFSGAGQNS
ncbi:MAG: hypothetical protein KDA42_07125 [Planctomycetales bacterium]|nr:hypothetical protein [Planctomycetales bacterium]